MRYLITEAEFHDLIGQSIELRGVTLGPAENALDVADALSEVLDSLEEAFFDDVPDPNGEEAQSERRRLRALRFTIDLLETLAGRGV